VLSSVRAALAQRGFAIVVREVAVIKTWPPPVALLLVFSLLLAPHPARAQWRANGAPVCTAANDQTFPVVTPEGAGGAIIAWSDLRNGVDNDVFAQHVLASGAVDPAWPANGRGVCVVTDDQSDVTITGDGSGGAIITWDDRRNGTDYNIYAQHVLASGAADPAWPANGRALCTASKQQFFPTIASDLSGGAIVTWHDNRGADFDIYAQHVLASGAVDPAWPANGRLVCGATDDQFDPVIVGDGAHGAIIVWSDSRSGTSFDVYTQHVLASGAVDPAWPADGRAVCVAADDQADAVVVSDGAGGAIAAWDDRRTGTSYDIYAHHVLASGVVDAAWGANGRALCTASGDQFTPSIVRDAGAGAVVAWDDGRSGTGFDIYAQHVQASGAVDPSWPGDGRAVCTATNDQTDTAIIADGSGGGIVTWADRRSSPDSDIYAQHVQASGAVDPAWPAQGRAVCTATNDQSPPAITTDGAGGAIITWPDRRSGTSYDIYAERVRASGTIVSVTQALPLSFRIYPPEPNPSRSGATIRLDLPALQQVSIVIFDLAGRKVRTLASIRELPAGRHRFAWDGVDDAGVPLRSGLYIVRVSAGPRSFTSRLTVLR